MEDEVRLNIVNEVHNSCFNDFSWDETWGLMWGLSKFLRSYPNCKD